MARHTSPTQQALPQRNRARARNFSPPEEQSRRRRTDQENTPPTPQTDIYRLESLRSDFLGCALLECRIDLVWGIFTLVEVLASILNAQGHTVGHHGSCTWYILCTLCQLLVGSDMGTKWSHHICPYLAFHRHGHPRRLGRPRGSKMVRLQQLVHTSRYVLRTLRLGEPYPPPRQHTAQCHHSLHEPLCTEHDCLDRDFGIPYCRGTEVPEGLDLLRNKQSGIDCLYLVSHSAVVEKRGEEVLGCWK